MPPTVDVFEAIHIARMLRVLKPDPVPDALIQQMPASSALQGRGATVGGGDG